MHITEGHIILIILFPKLNRLASPMERPGHSTELGQLRITIVRSTNFEDPYLHLQCGHSKLSSQSQVVIFKAYARTPLGDILIGQGAANLRVLLSRSLSQ